MEQNADLLFFFAKKPNALPLYEAFAQRVLAQVGAADIRVQKTQISFANRHNFAFASLLPVRKAAQRPDPYLTITFGLERRVESPRIDAAVEPDIGAIRLAPGDRLLLCTDGLSDLLDAAMLAQALDPATETVDSAASRLLALALAGGGHDNIALIVADPEAGSDDDAAGVRRS